MGRSDSLRSDAGGAQIHSAQIPVAQFPCAQIPAPRIHVILVDGVQFGRWTSGKASRGADWIDEPVGEQLEDQVEERMEKQEQLAGKYV